MKLATYEKDGKRAVGVVVDDRIVPVGETSMLDFIAKGAAALDQARQAAADAATSGGSPLSEIKLLAPVPTPVRNVFCVGRNYKLHIEEGARARGVPASYPEVPEFFTKATNTVVSTGAEIRLPAITKKFDYEVELAFVIGKDGRDIPAEKALDHIFGFTIVNDVTARDLQRQHGQWFKGKSLDTTCPMGPHIVTADAFDIRKDNRIWLKVNGEMRQDSLTTDMVFDCIAIIESLSAGMTLRVGDVVATGTPSGVGMGFDPQIWLKDGDVIEAGIDGIGSLVNTVRAV